MSKVNRSTYQSLAEEYKRLLADIKLLVEDRPSAKKILCIGKWRARFKQEEEFNSLMKKVAIKYITFDNKVSSQP